jgi:hypothetical protein
MTDINMREKGKWVLAKDSSFKSKLLTCPLCGASLLKGQAIAVIAFPIAATDNLGGYNYIPDFVKNEKVVHYACLPNSITNISSDKTYETPKVQTVSEVANDLRRILESMGEKVSQHTAEEFVFENCSMDTHSLLSIWFTKRSTFG